MKVTLRMPHVDRMTGTARYGLALADALEGLGVLVQREEERKLELRLGRLWIGGGLSGRLAQWRRPRKADCVHATTPYCNPRQAADIVTVHDVMPITHPTLFGTAPGTDFGKPPVRRALRRHVLVTTEDTKQALQQLFPEAMAERIHVTPLGVDHATFHPAPGDDPALRPGMLNVVAVLPIEQRKRLDLLVDAALALPFVHVVHVGNLRPPPAHHDASARAAQARATLTQAGRFVALGRIGDDRLRTLLSSADVVAQLSEAEGFGLPPLEALACGARVLASDIPAHRQVLGSAARYVPLDVASVRAALADAWDGSAVHDARFPARPQRLAQARAYTWERTAALTLEAYRAAAGDRPR